MNVLVANTFEPSGLRGLEALGCEVIYAPDVGEGLVDTMERLAPAVLVVRGTRVTAAAMTPTLRLIVRAGAGLNTIDVATARARGIRVENCPGLNGRAVAELTMGLLLALDRRIPDAVSDMRAGRWDKKGYSRARGLYGRSLGILGLGSIGCEVIRRASAFGMPVVAWSRRFDGQDRPLSRAEVTTLGLDPVSGAISLAPTPAAVAARVDALSIHVALDPSSVGLVNREVLANLKPGAILINTARGDVVDAAALADAIRERQLRVGLDAYAQEPASSVGSIDDPLLRLPGVYGTPHVGGSTDQAQEAIAAEVVRIVKSFMGHSEEPL